MRTRRKGRWLLKQPRLGARMCQGTFFFVQLLCKCGKGITTMLNKKTVDDLKNLKGRRVLVRCDFNVPLKNGVITDETRIVAALPTIQKLISDGAKVILCSHLGKVKNGPNEGESLAPVAKRLSEKLRQRSCIRIGLQRNRRGGNQGCRGHERRRCGSSSEYPFPRR